jgi:DNA mismatch repair ATPase MutS
VLRALSFGNLLCFAATHDIELTTLLADRYENHHFDEGLDEEGNVCFDYILKSGPSVNRNAIRLLKANGYPTEITDTAEEMAVNFNKTGKWSI